MKSISLVILSITGALAQSDPCKTAHTDQASCDADKKTGGGCTWCKCGALPSACWTFANSKKLPPGVYQCDAADDLALNALNALVAPTAPNAAVFRTWSSPVTTTCVGTGCSGSSSKGTMAYSAAQNKSAWKPSKVGGQGSPTVVDFDARAAFFMTGVGGTCSYACPLVSGSTLCNEQVNPNVFCEYDYLHKTKYVDTEQGTDHFHMNAGIGPITMVQYDYFMDTKTHYPVEVLMQLQPFGKFLGNITTHFDSFTVAEPDASLFEVPNMQNCPKGTEAQCNDVNMKGALLAGMTMEQ